MKTYSKSFSSTPMLQRLTSFFLFVFLLMSFVHPALGASDRVQYQANNKPVPALIPLPQKIRWTKKPFSLATCRGILIRDSALMNEALVLQKCLDANGFSFRIIHAAGKNESVIELRMSEDSLYKGKEGAYRLQCNPQGILISAGTRSGLFYGIQTVRQLMGSENHVAGCEIEDYPAFSFRGFMVDVGRNYQSVKQLKQQIEVMAEYKLNVFHFHLTEDLAWRLQSKQYPQLTDASNMLRNPGKYYSFDEMRDLILFAAQRHITLIPELDMPGHSAAFKRALGVDMQSEQGMAICKNILQELCNELDVPYVHIGGDEVKITNKEFLPEILTWLSKLGKKGMAWDPGGNVPTGTILQMWNGKTIPKDNFPSVDSRHLYLNHFDPIDGVVATFNHQICDVAAGDAKRLGAILCNWPDRFAQNEEDLIRMNAVYPVMLSFAERCWKGGGIKNFVSDIGTPGSERYDAFVAFEKRLLHHKKEYFRHLPFPYVKQADVAWHLVGPFNNEGNTSKVFAPESKSFMDTLQWKNLPTVYGGTIWLRHFWHPMIQSHLKDQQDSATYYAVRKIWSPKAGYRDFWIGFNNLSRSTASDSPPLGHWDDKHSAVWVNGNLVSPPRWRNAGAKGSPESSLTDEGYEYRQPTAILLSKGWNTILLKCPVASFVAPDSQNPVKWMFTFLLAQ